MSWGEHIQKSWMFQRGATWRSLGSFRISLLERYLETYLVVLGQLPVCSLADSPPTRNHTHFTLMSTESFNIKSENGHLLYELFGTWCLFNNQRKTYPLVGAIWIVPGRVILGLTITTAGSIWERRAIAFISTWQQKHYRNIWIMTFSPDNNNVYMMYIILSIQ